MMKRYLKKILKKIIEPLALRLGYRTNKPIKSELQKNLLLNTFFTNLKAFGFTPRHIIDVGANHGGWTRETLKYFPDAYYTLLEPQKWLQSSFQDLLNSNKKITAHGVGAGSKSGQFEFTILDRDDSSSFKYSKDEAAEAGFKQIAVDVITLNELVDTMNGLPYPDLVKIDAEGLDLEVLKGANKLFGNTEIFMVEASLGNKDYKNSVLEVIKFMDRNGYVLFDLTDLNRPFKVKILWLVELVFVKKEGRLDNIKLSKT